MKKPMLLVASACLVNSFFVPAMAAAPSSADQQTQKISQMEKQLNNLQHQVFVLKKQAAVSHKTETLKSKKFKRVEPAAAPASHAQHGEQRDQIEGPTDLPKSGTMYLPLDLDTPGQSFVSSGPYVGIPLEYSGSNLIINSPSVNQDVFLLNLRKNVSQRLASYGRPDDASGSHILLSGQIQGQALYANHAGSDNESDINISTASLDAYMLGPTRWTSGLLELNYDNSLGPQSNNRTQNSRVYINKAFVVIGDFLETPFYASFGQMFVPFGTYSTTMVSDPLTQLLARTQTRAAVFGYRQQNPENNLYAAAYIFKGASYASETSRINNGGLNVGYAFKMKQVNADVGAGVIANIADSQGMQSTGGGPLFAGFGGRTVPTLSNGVTTLTSTGNEQLVRRVPAYDVHALLGVGDNVQVIGEYITAARAFDSQDMTFNNHGAKPQALSVEGVYNIPYFSHTSAAVAYGMTKDALALGLPAKRYSFVVNKSWWKDTLQSLEFRHEVNYSATSTSSGSGIAGPTGLNRSDNILTFQFSYYF